MTHHLMTPTCRMVLKQMLKAHEAEDWENAEIVQDGGEVWIGDQRISTRTVDRLLCMLLLRHESSGGCDHYTLNEEGRKVAADPTYTPPSIEELQAAAQAAGDVPRETLQPGCCRHPDGIKRSGLACS